MKLDRFLIEDMRCFKGPQEVRIRPLTVPSALVDREEKTLGKIKSNDPHLLALAIASRVRVLVSRDTNLGEDFKRLTSGSIYKNASHQRLLTRDLCP